jgi:hypothetical protein
LPILIWGLGWVAGWLMPGDTAMLNATHALTAIGGGFGLLYGLIQGSRLHSLKNGKK